MSNLLSELNPELEYDFEGGEGDIEMLEELIDIQEEAANLETYAVESINMCVEMERFEKMGEVIAEHGITTGIAAALETFGMDKILAHSGVTVAMESLDADSKNVELATAATEGFMDVAKKWAAAIKKFFMDMIAWVKRFFARWFTAAGRLQAAIGSLKKKASDIKNAKKLDTNITTTPHDEWNVRFSSSLERVKASNLPSVKAALAASKDALASSYTSEKLSKAFYLDRNELRDKSKNEAKKGTISSLGWNGDKAVKALDDVEALFKQATQAKLEQTNSEADLKKATADADAFERMNPTDKEAVDLKKKQLSAARLTSSYAARYTTAVVKDLVKCASVAVKVSKACIRDAKQKD